MSDDYIKREAAIKEFSNNGSIFVYGKQKCEAIVSRLNTIPAADVVERKRGEWYGEADGYADGELVYDIWACSCCGKYFHEWEEKPDWNFCPNCGAMMEES